MKKLVLSLAVLFTLSSAFVSCRDTKNEETIEVNVEDDAVAVDDEIIATDDDATDPIENTVQEARDNSSEIEVSDDGVKI
jgi:hypothetical protein